MRQLDLFSGIGGLYLAAKWAGIETVAFVEKNEYCQRVLRKNAPGIPIYGDIHDVTDDVIRDIGWIDIVAGGFPCQPFSQAGQRRGKADDRYLWPEMLRIINVARPRWVVGENVAGIVDLALDDVLADLEAAGYEAWSVVFPACAVGAPHIRQRVFIIAHATSARSGRLSVRPRQSRQGKNDPDGHRTDVAYTERAERRPPAEEGQHKSDRAQAGWRQNAGGLAIRGEGGRGRSGRDGQAESGMGGMGDGIPAWLDGGADPWQAGEWEGTARLTSKKTHRVARLRALGNAVVPAQVYPIFKYIMEA